MVGQWRIAKNGGGYTQRGVAKGLKIPCLFMITEVSIRSQKNPEVCIRRIPAYTPPQYTTGVGSGDMSVGVNIPRRDWLITSSFAAGDVADAGQSLLVAYPGPTTR